jgi:hypothetical protein
MGAIVDGRHCSCMALLFMHATVARARKGTRRLWRTRRMDQAVGDLRAAIISGDPGMARISIEPPASAQNSLQ